LPYFVARLISWDRTARSTPHQSPSTVSLSVNPTQMRSCRISLAAIFPICVEFDPIVGTEFIQCSGLRLSCSCDDNQGSCMFHHSAEEIFKRATIVAVRQTKRCPEKFRCKTKNVSENSLKIETARKLFCKISCISIYRLVDRLAHQSFSSKATVNDTFVGTFSVETRFWCGKSASQFTAWLLISTSTARNSESSEK
jgi:hypothetical protein